YRCRSKLAYCKICPISAPVESDNRLLCAPVEQPSLPGTRRASTFRHWRGEFALARERRKLSAILAADVVGYSRLMGLDESGTFARLKVSQAERLGPALTRNGGRVVRLTGDGVLAEFASAVDALKAAIEFQQAAAAANRGQPEDAVIVFRV